MWKHCQLFFAYGKRKLLFQLFEVDWLTLKIGGHLGAAKTA